MGQDNEKKLTRKNAERAITLGNNETVEALRKHQNYHVRKKAWVKLGKPMPEKDEDCVALYNDLHMVKERNAFLEQAKERMQVEKAAAAAAALAELAATQEAPTEEAAAPTE